MRDLALVVADLADRKPLRIFFAVLAAIDDFAVPGATLLQAPPSPDRSPAPSRPNSEIGIAADHLIRGVAGDGGEGPIDGENAIAAIADHDAVTAFFKDLGAQTQLLEGTAACSSARASRTDRRPSSPVSVAITALTRTRASTILGAFPEIRRGRGFGHSHRHRQGISFRTR